MQPSCASGWIPQAERIIPLGRGTARPNRLDFQPYLHVLGLMSTDQSNASDPRRSIPEGSGPPWPPRAQRLIGAMHALCLDWLHESLRQCLGHFDVLVGQPGSPANSAKGNTRTRQQVLDEQRGFDQRFCARIDKAFDELGMSRSKPAPTPPPVLHAPLSLALLDQVEHDLDGALAQLVVRSETRHGPVLIELGYRMAALIGAPPLPSAALPMGPQVLSAAFRVSCRTMGLPISHEVLLVQAFESTVMLRMQPLYELLNSQLRSDGILPNLHPFSSPRALASLPAVATVDALPTTVARINLSPDSGPPATNVTGSAWNPSAPASRSRTAHSATTLQLQDALSTLQRTFGELDEQLRAELRRHDSLQQELLDQLNIDHSFGADSIELTAAHMHALNCTVQLFDALQSGLASDSGRVRSLVAEMLLPILRVSLTDPRFFADPVHPARRWLVAMLGAAHFWLDGATGIPGDHLAKAMTALIARAANDPVQTSLYENLLVQLDGHLRLLSGHAAETGQSHVNATHDQERLHTARVRADELLRVRCADLAADSPQQALLDQPWRDVLALTLLRHGEASDIFAVQLVIVDQLVGRFPMGDRAKLQAQIEDGLHQIGMPRKAASTLATNAVSAHASPTADSTSTDSTSAAARLANRFKQRASHPIKVVRSASSTLHATSIDPNLRALHDHLLGLSTPTWFSFVGSGDKPAKRHRLAWCSPTSGRCLFLTPLGDRAEECSLADLDEAMRCGRISELPRIQDLLDAAWPTPGDAPPDDPEATNLPS